jgi:hypothetical protein
MHQRTEPELREAMQRLLAPLDMKWVAAQVGVTRQQADRWRKGENVRVERLQQVADAVRTLLPEYSEAAPPAWAERLREEVVSDLRTILEESALDELADKLDALIVGAQRPDGAQAADPPAALDDASSSAR